jgi:hypothetical protein
MQITVSAFLSQKKMPYWPVGGEQRSERDVGKVTALLSVVPMRVARAFQLIQGVVSNIIKNTFSVFAAGWLRGVF